jgi:hypothetical protein
MPLEKETRYETFCHSYKICVIYKKPPSILSYMQLGMQAGAGLPANPRRPSCKIILVVARRHLHFLRQPMRLAPAKPVGLRG